MKAIKMLFVFLLISLSIKAQDEEISRYDYGFQIDDVMPMRVPRGYTPIHSVRLRKPIQEGWTYEVTTSGSIVVPRSYEAYTYEFWIFESNWTKHAAIIC